MRFPWPAKEVWLAGPQSVRRECGTCTWLEIGSAAKVCWQTLPLRVRSEPHAWPSSKDPGTRLSNPVMNRSEVFNEHRSLLMSIAYRMLGSHADAEDAVQETFLRWQNAPNEDIQTAKAYLSTILTRLCIDQLRSARRQREVYVGPWLPEPMLTSDQKHATANVELAESLTMAFLVLLESLSPVERA